MSMNFISLVTSCFGHQEVEPQPYHPMAWTWVSHIAASVLMGLGSFKGAEDGKHIGVSFEKVSRISAMEDGCSL